MNNKILKRIENKIEKIRAELQRVGEMRPGSLSKQFTKPGKQRGAYYQLSYTYKMKSRTEYVRPEFVGDIKKQISQYKRFKKLVEKWIDMAIKHSRLKTDIIKSSGAKPSARRKQKSCLKHR